MSVRVAAIVPVFGPDPSALLSLVTVLVDSGVPTLVVDDASPERVDFGSLVLAGANVSHHAVNAGIARSLNDGLAFAVEHGADWLLTVDQDTTLPAGYVDALLAVVNAHHERGHRRIGVIGAETIGDAAGDLHYPTREVDGLLTTQEVFQTGALWSVEALQLVGGFDEHFGIDAVDAAACLRLREAGFAVALAPRVRLEHRYGSGKKVRVLGRDVFATNHSPARRETMVRNRLRLFPRELRQSPVHALRTMRRLGMNVLMAVTVEDDRWEKAKGAMRGLRPAKDR